MTKIMDYMISPLPIRIVDLKVDSSKLKISGLRILQIGHLPGRTLRRENVTFDNWAIVFITGGEGTIEVRGGRLQKIESGSMLFVYPGLTLSFGPLKYWDEYYIRFEGDRIKEWIKSNMIKQELNVKNVGVSSNWINKIESIFFKMDSGLPEEADRAALLLEHLIYECSQWNGETAAKKTNSTLFLAIIEELTSNLNPSINAEEIAERYHLSVSTLRRLIKQNSGYPLHEYCHRLKMERAQKYLITTDESIKEISLKLGYSDPYYFSRLFKRISGISPQQFRKQY
ncbi:helix-turn-helix domain-containing protein [Bacillus sp. M6-12]|uniref:helix-turn-helix domain-containing protein n=1 Tax=Bacillus sp. M6-12 TaxID=2054166 RepID=UPI0015E08635|nr:AraC family transcriptional regulator [Bacillus sp. M6-12]